MPDLPTAEVVSRRLDARSKGPVNNEAQGATVQGQPTRHTNRSSRALSAAAKLAAAQVHFSNQAPDRRRRTTNHVVSTPELVGGGARG